MHHAARQATSRNPDSSHRERGRWTKIPRPLPCIQVSSRPSGLCVLVAAAAIPRPCCRPWRSSVGHRARGRASRARSPGRRPVPPAPHPAQCLAARDDSSHSAIISVPEQHARTWAPLQVLPLTQITCLLHRWCVEGHKRELRMIGALHCAFKARQSLLSLPCAHSVPPVEHVLFILISCIPIRLPTCWT
jgi:hypothetical protein